MFPDDERYGLCKQLRRAAASPGSVRPRLAGLHGTLGEQVVEVAAHSGRRQVQALGQDRGRAGAELEQRAGDALPGGGVDLARALGYFHNTIVSLLAGRFK